MARRKRTPELSTITRNHLVAYSRKQKSDGGDDADGDNLEEANVTDADLVKAALATMKMPQQTDPKPDPKPDLPDRPTMPFDPLLLEQIVASNPPDDDGIPDSPRTRLETTTMPMGGFGAPPEIPASSPSSPGIVLRGGAVEDPTHMPGPRDMPPGTPDDVASPPGFVPAGDSRSLRRRGDVYEFALIYRQGNAVISRVGVIGTRGVWRVVEYPTTASASHAYAKEASRFVSEGFSDYRE
jgi:hypothetical protein